MADVLGPASLAVTQAVSLFNSFLPKLTEVRRADKSDEAFAADVRLGELAASGLIVGIGITLASLSDSYVPMAVGLIMALFLTMIYEYALNDNPLGVRHA